METDNKCFYRESPLYLERWAVGGGRAIPGKNGRASAERVSDAPLARPRFGFYKYMKMDREEGGEDREEVQRRAFLFLNPDGECPQRPHPQLGGPAAAHARFPQTSWMTRTTESCSTPAWGPPRPPKGRA